MNYYKYSSNSNDEFTINRSSASRTPSPPPLPIKESNFYYITVATKPHPVLTNLQKKVERMNETLIVLGESENRSIGWDARGNFGIKLREFSNFINKPELCNDDIVLFTDAFDVAYFGNKTEIVKRFREFENPIVFGCEKYCFPDPQNCDKYTDRDGREFPYLNSGMFIGYVWAFRLCISNYVYNDADDDQRFWTHMFFEKPELIELDYDNRLFLNMNDIDMNEFSYLVNTVFYQDRNPLFIHDNGPDKALISKFLT